MIAEAEYSTKNTSFQLKCVLLSYIRNKKCLSVLCANCSVSSTVVRRVFKLFYLHRRQAATNKTVSEINEHHNK